MGKKTRKKPVVFCSPESLKAGKPMVTATGSPTS
jgi:hypothetical protein